MAAELSPCGLYRYRLDRGEGRKACFIMLNPSTADAAEDDPTIRRCRGFAERWGLGGITVVNLFAFRATEPRELIAGRGAGRCIEHVKGLNDFYVQQAVLECPITIAAWGAQSGRLGRHIQCHAARLAHKLRWARLYALGTTNSGDPRHPLYLPNSATPQPWSFPDLERWRF